MLFRYETEVPLTGWGGECVLTEGDSSFGLAWLVTPASQTFPFHSGAVTLSHHLVWGWGWGGYPYSVWIRRAGHTCIQNLHGLSLGLSQTLARLEWLPYIPRKCAPQSGFSGEKSTLDYCQLFASFSRRISFSSPPCRAVHYKSLDSGCPINLDLNLRSSYLLAVWPYQILPEPTSSSVKWQKYAFQEHFMKMYVKGQAHTNCRAWCSKDRHQKVQDITSSPT